MNNAIQSPAVNRLSVDDKLVKWMAIFLTGTVSFQRLSMAAGNIFFAIALLLFLIWLYRGRKERLQTFKALSAKQWMVKGWLVFLATLVPAVILSIHPLLSLKTVLGMWIYRIVPFFIILVAIRKKNYLVNMLIGFLTVQSIDCMVCLYQGFVLHDPRPYGFGSSSLNLPSQMAMTIPALCILAADHRIPRKLQLWARGNLILAFWGFIIVKSRALWLLIAGTTPIYMIRYMWQRKIILLIVVLMFGIAGGIVSTNKYYQHRFDSTTNMTTDRSNADRLLVWESAFHMIEDHPIVGVGPGNFREVYNEGYKEPTVTQDMVHTHNNFIQTFAEAGVIGFAGFCYFLGVLLYENGSALWKDRVYARLRLVTLMGITLFGLIDYTMDASAIVKDFFFLMGCFTVLGQLEEKE